MITYEENPTESKEDEVLKGRRLQMVKVVSKLGGFPEAANILHDLMEELGMLKNT